VIVKLAKSELMFTDLAIYDLEFTTGLMQLEFLALELFQAMWTFLGSVAVLYMLLKT
jgi:hypothetical protein